MELTTTIIQRHKLWAPEGYKFVATQEQLEEVFGEDTNPVILWEGRCVGFEEEAAFSCASEIYWDELVDHLLVKQED